LSLSAFILKVLASAGWDGAPNFLPHDLGDFDGRNIFTLFKNGIISHAVLVFRFLLFVAIGSKYFL